jgi:hypothetical protein
MLVEKIMNVADLQSVIDLPWDASQQVEVFIIPLRPKDSNITAQSMQGILKEYADINLIESEKNAWQSNVEEKYGNIRH